MIDIYINTQKINERVIFVLVLCITRPMSRCTYEKIENKIGPNEKDSHMNETHYNLLKRITDIRFRVK